MKEPTELLIALPSELPTDVIAYRRTPEFTEKTLPEAFKAAHATKAGVWGLIHVLQGQLFYCLEEPHKGRRLIGPGETAPIPPGIPHRVAFVEGGRFFVEFFKKPSNEP
jgi:tellurite resistance-related uncharacterized protein